MPTFERTGACTPTSKATSGRGGSSRSTRNLKRVSLAYARELGLTPVARKAFKLSYDRESDLDKWIKLAYADDEEEPAEEPAVVTSQPTEPEPELGC